ncbi:MAG: CsbD family protein [Actinobacteria bacterium]|nr:CsbD family protein [Actinomycetota bacterium]
MSGTTDDFKGRAKEAAGAITGDEDLKNEGKADQVAGSIKHKAEDAKNWIEEKVDEVKERLHKD